MMFILNRFALSQRLNRDAGASLTAFPRRSVGTIIAVNGAVALKANWLGLGSEE